jgi:hypothetical protein
MGLLLVIIPSRRQACPQCRLPDPVRVLDEEAPALSQLLGIDLGLGRRLFVHPEGRAAGSLTGSGGRRYALG